MNSLDFKCASPVKMININNSNEGNINEKLENYSYDVNRKVMGEAYSQVDFLKETPQDAIDKRAVYPDGMNCSDKSYNDINNNRNSGIIFPVALASGFLLVTMVIILKKRNKLLN